MTERAANYHHGDLPAALRGSAAALLAERGPGGFSLREVARRAGVSHAAPAHHFGDAAGLLTSVAIEAFDHLVRVMQNAVEGQDDAVAQLRALGRAYVELGVSNPGHCAVMFRHDLVHAEDDAYAQAGNAAFNTLVEAVERVASDVNPDLDIALASATCWTAMQGLVELHSTMGKIRERASSVGDEAGAGSVTSGPASRLDALPEPGEIGDMAEAITQTIVDGLRG